MGLIFFRKNKYVLALSFWPIFILSSACQQEKTKVDPKEEIQDSSSINAEENSNIYEENPLAGTKEVDIAYHEPGEELEALKNLSDEEMIRLIFDEALLNGRAYDLLDFLANKIGGRISGSPQAAAAVEWAYQTLDTMEVERVWKQGVMVPRWLRGKKESARVINSNASGSYDLSVCALGGSIATPATGLNAEVIEVRHFDELRKLGVEKVRGKIVFFNRRMDPRFINTFYAYSGCVGLRWSGAMEAAKMGAVGVIVRSMTLAQDDYPHTGSMGYEEGIEKIPAMAISTNSADALSQDLKTQDNLKISMRQNCKTLPDALSYNVVGEIKGSEFPDEIILVGGHLDSWDLGDGAHDDGAGTVQSIEVLRILTALGIQPKRTIRVVLYMNEENGLRGGLKYAEIAQLRNENHIAAIETDRGGFAPRNFTVESEDESRLPTQLVILRSWIPMLSMYGIADFKEGSSGADIGPLRHTGTLLFGFVPESQRYFDYHHSELDKFDAVNKRELHLGAAAMAALVYMISEKGI